MQQPQQGGQSGQGSADGGGGVPMIMMQQGGYPMYQQMQHNQTGGMSYGSVPAGVEPMGQGQTAQGMDPSMMSAYQQQGYVMAGYPQVPQPGWQYGAGGAGMPQDPSSMQMAHMGGPSVYMPSQQMWGGPGAMAPGGSADPSSALAGPADDDTSRKRKMKGGGAEASSSKKKASDGGQFAAADHSQTETMMREYHQVHQAAMSSFLAERDQLAGPSPPGDSADGAASADRHIVPTDYRDYVQQYLEAVEKNTVSELEQTVTILHSKVVQKSYGTEKRFFCPPPRVILKGSKWQNAASNENLCLYVGMTNDHTSSQQVTLNESLGGIARTLYISDQDRRKRFCLQVKLFYEGTASFNKDVGTFSSRPIKVISKPARKKASAAHTDLCIESGSEIALFNRIRPQAGSTRYLTCSDSTFTCTARDWCSFIITLVGGSSAHKGAPYQTHTELITYNSKVILECANTHRKSKVYVVCKVEKNAVTKTSSDPVSQLQKIALAVDGVEHRYLGLQDGKITERQTTGTLRGDDDANKEERDLIYDGCIWTVSSTDHVEYTFYDPRQTDDASSMPVDPVPLVNFTKNLGVMVEIYGEHFTPRLSVWFGDVPAKTTRKCAELLVCHAPSIKDILKDGTEVCSQRKTVLLLLVRDDGVIYPTGKTYTYEVDPIAMLRESRVTAAE